MSNTTNTAAASVEATKHYAKRDHEAQGDHYINHVSAMTTEGLHAKSDIAAELAHRDIEIERLRAALAAPAQAVPAPGAIATMLEGLRHARKVLNHHNLALECGPVNIAIAAASAPAAPVGMEPVAWVEVRPGLDGWFLAYNFNPDAQTEPLYSGYQVQAMLAAIRSLTKEQK